MELEELDNLSEVDNKSKGLLCKSLTKYIITDQHIFIGVASVVSPDTKNDNPVIISNKSPIKDENEKS